MASSSKGSENCLSDNVTYTLGCIAGSNEVVFGAARVGAAFARSRHGVHERHHDDEFKGIEQRRKRSTRICIAGRYLRAISVVV